MEHWLAICGGRKEQSVSRPLNVEIGGEEEGGYLYKLLLLMSASCSLMPIRTEHAAQGMPPLIPRPMNVSLGDRAE